MAILFSEERRNSSACHSRDRKLCVCANGERAAVRGVRKTRTRYAICVSNDGYPASLEVRKVYRTIGDADGAERGLVRVLDESGEAYLYPEAYFVTIDVPKDAEACFATSVADDAEAE